MTGRPRPSVGRFPALGTIAVVAVTDPLCLSGAVDEVESEIRECDLACSRFRDDSDLSRLNRAAGRAAVAVSPWLIEALDVAVDAATETAGLVDPTVGSSLMALGYDRDFARMDKDGPPVASFRRVPGWRSIAIDRDRRRARVAPGVAVDLGATAKALCADRAAHRVRRRLDTGVLVGLGGDIAMIGPSPEKGWCVRVTDRADTPPESPVPGQTVSFGVGAVATSGTSARRWQRGGMPQHHIVDPRTSRPAGEYWRTVSVAASSCVDANIASTAAIIIGAGAPQWLSSRGLPARLVRPDGTVVVVNGWPSGPDDHDRTSVPELAA